MDQNALIVRGFAELCQEGRPAALATIVRVVGSSYRRPGARMLIAGDGRSWGGVSGGCLERDVVRRARLVIDTGRGETCRYDTSDEPPESGTVTATGCAGVIDLLVQPVSADQLGPLQALSRAIGERIPTQIATLIRSHGDLVLGTCFDRSNCDPALQTELETEIPRPLIREIAGDNYFIETIRPPQSLVIFGGGHDVIPLVAIARTLGWFVTVVASHGSAGYRERFALADRLVLGSADDPFGGVAVAPDASVVLMTHDYPRDLQLLPRLLAVSPRYLGVLGPRRRAERLVLEAPGVPADAIERLHAPVGMDLGAETPETIALSIAAEIQAVLAGRPSISLRDRSGPIYPRSSPGGEAPYQPVACPMLA